MRPQPQTPYRPKINYADKLRCLDDYQTTMLEETNKYRRMYGLKALQMSTELQYQALLASQKCEKKATISKENQELSLSSYECKKIAVLKAKTLHDSRSWIVLRTHNNYNYMGCAFPVNLYNSVNRCQYCYYQ